MNKLIKEKIINSNSFFTATLLLCLILFFYATINHNLSYRITSIDYYIQNEYSKSLIDGNGISRPMLDENDLSQKKYLRESLWPPGYITLNALFSNLTKLDYNKSYTIQKTFSDLFLLLVLLFIFYKNLRYFNKWAIPLFIFFISFNGFYFKKVGLLDNISLGLLLLSLQLLFSTKNNSFKLIFFGLICFTPAIFRPAYYCLIFIAPSLHIVQGLMSDKKIYKRHLIPLFTTLFLLVCQLCFIKFYFAFSINPIESLAYQDSRFFLENLATFDAIFLNAFIYDNDLLRLVNQFLPFFSMDEFYFKLFSSTFFFLLVLFPIIHFIKHKNQNKSWNNILIALFLSSIFSVLFLSALSFYYPPFPVAGETFNRSWVMFTRYHILTEFTILLFFFFFIFSKKQIIRKKYKMLLLFVLIFVTSLNVFNWIYNEIKTMKYEPVGVIKDVELIKNEIRGFNKKVIYISTKYDVQENEYNENNFMSELYSCTYGMAVLKNLETIKTSENIYCIIPVPKNKKHPLYKKVTDILVGKKIKKINYSESLNKDIYLVLLER